VTTPTLTEALDRLRDRQSVRPEDAAKSIAVPADALAVVVAELDSRTDKNPED
jgi:hypothetical protein